MSAVLESAKQRERSAERSAYRNRYVLTDTELARLIATTVRAVPRKVKLSDSERDAIGQLAAERITRQLDGSRAWPIDGPHGSRGVFPRPARGKRSGSPLAVLRWIEYAERTPTFAARRELAERGNVGREYVTQVVSQVVARDAHDWRDVATDYAKHRESERPGPMVVSADALTSESGEPVGWLAVATERDSAANGVPGMARVSVDRHALADELVHEMPDAETLTPRDRECVRTALLANLPDGDGEPVEGPALAAELGVSYGTVRNRISRGRFLWEGAYPDSRDAVVAVRLAAERLSLKRGERSKRTFGESPALTLEQMGALKRAEGAKREQSKRTHAYINGSRGGSATVRASEPREPLQASGSPREVLAWIDALARSRSRADAVHAASRTARIAGASGPALAPMPVPIRMAKLSPTEPHEWRSCPVPWMPALLAKQAHAHRAAQRDIHGYPTD